MTEEAIGSPGLKRIVSLFSVSHFMNLETSGCSSHFLETTSKDCGNFFIVFWWKANGSPSSNPPLGSECSPIYNCLQLPSTHISSSHEFLHEIFTAVLILAPIKIFFVCALKFKGCCFLLNIYMGLTSNLSSFG